MLNFSDISWIGIIAATVASFMLGGLWFTVLLGRAYSAALGRAHDPGARPAPLMIAGPAAWSLVTAFATAVLMASLGIETLSGALGLGLFVGIGYLAATTVNTGINPNIPNPLLYGAVSGGYHLAAGLVIALVLSFF
ncbi:DUF1761 domain-containing protein [Frigidibacter mobilis]|uniref:DUF1761 domain-containing protein n=1 Tax=Frigidibacter mobilis TaxID=1335048 RepID=A0A159Z1R5_9RHOB|nr:DUF1761 domain-containing protein [Frigidibacter mobilis]AMY68882.1 hypothetical protein AKL17_1630 [Frigidibacter mobilis]